MRSLTAEQMREVNQIALEEFNPGVLQMIRKAGPALVLHPLQILQPPEASVDRGGSPPEWQQTALLRLARKSPHLPRAAPAPPRDSQ